MRLEGACNIIVALHMPAIAAERKEQIGLDEPSLNPKNWRWPEVLNPPKGL